MTDQRVELTADQAIELLPDGKSIHTFRSSPMCLIGADWNRKKLLAVIRRKAVRLEIGGEMCCRVNHGLVVWTEPNHPLFVECRAGTDYTKYDVQQTVQR